MQFITRNVWILSLVSLFTDMASEMLYPIMPLYLKSIGFSVIIIGVLEGCAEATAGLSKGYFGKLSDNKGRRLPFVQIGYALSALSKPMMAVMTFPVWIFFSRTIDRLGKGIRTGARDALLSDEATKETKARVFGFHRSMDTFGAVLGPLLALIYLAYKPDNYKTLFYIAFLPGILAIAATYFIREKNKPLSVVKRNTRFLDFIRFWKVSPANYKKLVRALLLFALFNSSDVFLLLKLKESGVEDKMLILIYIFYNLIYAILAYPIGIIADKIGMKNVFICGLIVFFLVYTGMAFCHTTLSFFILFFMYGIYAASTEGVAKAWISNLCQKEDTATAIGTYSAFQSIAGLLASSMAGLLWYLAGSSFTLILSAFISIVVALYIYTIRFKSV